MRRWFQILLSFLAAAGSGGSAAAQPSVVDPALSVTQVVDGLALPTAMAFIGANDFLILEKDSGQVRRVTGGVLQPAPVLDLSVSQCGESGLLGIAVHPDFPAPAQVFLYFTEIGDEPDACGPTPLGNQLVRYTWNASTGLLESPLPLLSPPLPATSDTHAGGTLAFGPDGMLYGVIGDQHRFGQLQNNPLGDAADDTGIIFRIDTGGNAPMSNPFFGEPGLDIVFAFGVRNAFGLAFDPVSGELWDSENGPGTYDELNRITPGTNSGWREIMGPATRCAPGCSIDDLTEFPGSLYADPEFSWLATVAPTGVAFVADPLGASYQNDLFVGDSNNGDLYHFELAADRMSLVLSGGLSDQVADSDSERVAARFGSGFGGGFGISDLKPGADGLYVVSIGDGAVYRIATTTTSTSTTTTTSTTSTTLASPPSPGHDLALASLKCSKKVVLRESQMTRSKRCRAKVANLGDHPETIPDLATLTALVPLVPESLGACPSPSVQLEPPKQGFPLELAPGKKLRLRFALDFSCANDPLASTKSADHADFRIDASVDHSVLGVADANAANDVCPRSASGADKGCGPKGGGELRIDVVVK